MDRRNRTTNYMNEKPLSQSEVKLIGITIDLIRSTLMRRADEHMINDDFERSANDYFLAAHMCPPSDFEVETLYGYRIGKIAIRAINEDLGYPSNAKLTRETLRDYNRYLNGNL